MSKTDHIKLLPESLANQIAAGEVIQRPASAVKELLENAVDAGADHIQLILKDSGKTLIQIIDNGKGMSEMDARMCFERHATSKINSSEDLFSITTKGFRGEALASMAAVAQVELKTKLASDELGTRIVIAGSKIKTQEVTSTSIGSNFSVKNLFYNVPARRKFLKSDPVELKHILEEFQRLALAHPEIFFTCSHNGNEVYHLPKGNLRQRIINVFGKNFNDKLIPVKEEADFMTVTGFVGKPSTFKKNKTDQYFFVNQRFVKSHYLAHAVKGAYDDLISDDLYPFFCLYIEIDPSKIDINVHPTKTEIKFEDERLNYNYIRVSVRHALGQFNITPSLDFEQSPTALQFETRTSAANNDGAIQSGSQASSADKANKKDFLDNWDKLYEGLEQIDENKEGTTLTLQSQWDNESDAPIDFDLNKKRTFQVHNSYIISQVKNGLMLIDQKAAHERILYEKNKKALKQKTPLIQKALFPESVELNATQAELFKELIPIINQLGFIIEEFGKNTFVIQGIPAELSTNLNTAKIITDFLDTYNENLEFKLDSKENIARSLAKCTATKRNKMLHEEEINEIINELFACEMPYVNPAGKKCFIMLSFDNIQQLFN